MQKLKLKNDILEKYNQLINENEYRINSKYRTINGYKSASKLLSEMQNKDFLDDWKSRIGEKEAIRIIEAASARGKVMHDLIEKYLLTQCIVVDDNVKGTNHFKKMIPLLTNVEPILLESTLFNNKLEITGRCDCIGFYKGVLSVIDFKTSRKPKVLKYMKSYMIQVTLYSLMFYDMFGIKLSQGVLLNSPDDEDVNLINPSQEFVFNLNESLNLTLELLQRYRNGERKCLNL